MNLDELKQILDIFREHELSEFELEQEGFKIRVKRDGVPAIGVPAIAAPTPVRVAAAPAAGVPQAMEAAAAANAADVDVELAVVKSPIVGTFYRAAEPGSRPFVEIGDVVRKGQVLCIIEAMKLMNEIDSEYEGEVVSIYVENGQPVQYGERLFAIKPKS